MKYTDQVRTFERILNRTDHIAADTPAVPSTPELRAPTFALAYAAARLLDRQHAERKESSMKPPTTSPISPSPALLELRQRGAAEAERQRSRPRDTYFAALDRRYFAAVENHALASGTRPPAPVRLLDALDAELAALGAGQKLRPPFAAALKRYPEPAEHDAKPLADLMHSLRGAAQGALSILDQNPGQLERWKRRITDVPNDVGSPEALAAIHFGELRPLLDQARTLRGALDDLARLERETESLATELLARGAPVEIRMGKGPLERDAASAPARSKTVELHHGV